MRHTVEHTIVKHESLQEKTAGQTLPHDFTYKYTRLDVAVLLETPIMAGKVERGLLGALVGPAVSG